MQLLSALCAIQRHAPVDGLDVWLKVFAVRSVATQEAILEILHRVPEFDLSEKRELSLLGFDLPCVALAMEVARDIDAGAHGECEEERGDAGGHSPRQRQTGLSHRGLRCQAVVDLQILAGEGSGEVDL